MSLCPCISRPCSTNRWLRRVSSWPCSAERAPQLVREGRCSHGSLHDERKEEKPFQSVMAKVRLWVRFLPMVARTSSVTAMNTSQPAPSLPSAVTTMVQGAWLSPRNCRDANGPHKRAGAATARRRDGAPPRPPRSTAWLVHLHWAGPSRRHHESGRHQGEA